MRLMSLCSKCPILCYWTLFKLVLESFYKLLVILDSFFDSWYYRMIQVLLVCIVIQTWIQTYLQRILVLVVFKRA